MPVLARYDDAKDSLHQRPSASFRRYDETSSSSSEPESDSSTEWLDPTKWWEVKFTGKHVVLDWFTKTLLENTLLPSTTQLMHPIYCITLPCANSGLPAAALPHAQDQRQLRYLWNWALWRRCMACSHHVMGHHMLPMELTPKGSGQSWLPHRVIVGVPCPSSLCSMRAEPFGRYPKNPRMPLYGAYKAMLPHVLNGVLKDWWGKPAHITQCSRFHQVIVVHYWFCLSGN